MAGSLFDQLQNAGLVDAQKAKKAKKAKHQQAKQNKGKKKPAQVSEAALLVEKAAKQQAEKDRQLNLERQQRLQEKAKQAEVLQLLESNQLKGFEGEIVYNFADDKQVKTFNVNAKTQKALVSERLRIARFNGGYVLITAEVAEKVAQRDETVLIALSDNDDNLSQADKDYYAQFEIPDDLIW